MARAPARGYVGMPAVPDPTGFRVMAQVWPSQGRGSTCVGFSDVPLVRPTRVLVAADLPAHGQRDALLGALRGGVATLAKQPGRKCGGPGEIGCWATQENAARNILVFVASEGAPASPAAEQLVDDWLGRDFEAIGVVRSGHDPDAVLPPGLRNLNAVLWRSDVREILPELLDTILLDHEDRRIFVSYARADGSPTAERVFDLLAQARFDVFLDRFRLPPGADFLERIEDEILDKAMVVVVETPEAVRSPWVRHEVNVAAARRLGLAAINLSSADTIREIAEDARSRIDDDTALRRFLLEQHRTQLSARRDALRESVYLALRGAGLPPAAIVDTAHGFTVAAPGGRRVVAVSTRPADLHRFRLADEEAGGDEAFVIHPQPSLHRRRRDLAWLSDRSGVVEVDEGRITHAAGDIAS